MSVKNCNSKLRTILVCSASVLVFFLLSGCNHMSETTSSSTSKDCEETEVLMTDLTVLENQRQYMLPDGRLCPSHQVANQESVSDDNKIDKEESRNEKNK